MAPLDGPFYLQISIMSRDALQDWRPGKLPARPNQPTSITKTVHGILGEADSDVQHAFAGIPALHKICLPSKSNLSPSLE